MGRAPLPGALELVANRLEELTGGKCEVIPHEIDRDVVAGDTLFPRHRARAVNDLLGRENITRCTCLPNCRLSPSTRPPEYASEAAANRVSGPRSRCSRNAWPAMVGAGCRPGRSLARPARPYRRPRQLWPDRLHFHHRGVGAGTRSAEMEAAPERESANALLVSQAAGQPEERESTPVMFDNRLSFRPFEPLVRSPGAAQVRGILIRLR